jgi:hypothetical protein
MAAPDDILRARVHRAIREAWPDLADDAVTAVGFDVGRLIELLQEELGRDDEESEHEARNLMLNALTPNNGGNAGWVEVLREEDETPLARGQLYLHDTTPDLATEPPAGAIVHLRVHEGAAPLEAGSYRVRFEENGEIRPIATVTDQSPALPDMVALVFLDDGQPITVLELSEGD